MLLTSDLKLNLKYHGKCGVKLFKNVIKYFLSQVETSIELPSMYTISNGRLSLFLVVEKKFNCFAFEQIPQFFKASKSFLPI